MTTGTREGFHKCIMSPTVNSAGRLAAFFILVVSLLTSGCAYRGHLNSGFYNRPTTEAKIPVRANLVCGTHMAGREFSTEIYIGHSVYIKTHPALEQALTEVCQSLFDTVEVTSVVSVNIQDRADVILLPDLEMRYEDIKLSVVVKSATTHEFIRRYEAYESVYIPIPASVHCLGVLNICFGGLIIPIYPINTQLLGSRAEDRFEASLSACLSRIAQDIENDRVLLTKAKTR